jgi:hypothetical protein
MPLGERLAVDGSDTPEAASQQVGHEVATYEASASSHDHQIITREVVHSRPPFAVQVPSGAFIEGAILRLRELSAPVE